MRESCIRLLVLFAKYTDFLSYYDDWLEALENSPVFATTAIDIVAKAAGEPIRKALSEVDAVVLLHSTNADTTKYLGPLASMLADRRAPLLSFVGNEVNLPGSPIAEKRQLLWKIQPEWIATQLMEQAGQYLFGDIARHGVISLPHALNPRVFRELRPIADRTIDIGVRSVRYLPILGDDDRNRIIDKFAALGRKGLLTTDITGDRLDRDGWSDLLNRCRGTVSTEAGSWYLDRDDATINAIREYIQSKNVGMVIARDSFLGRIGAMLPWPLRRLLRQALNTGLVRHEAMEFERLEIDEIHARFFAQKPKPTTYNKCISSRHFDAIGTKTCQIMFRGRFNDILIADQHYFALERNFSNLDDVLRRFADACERRRIAENALAHILSMHTYQHRVSRLEAILRASSAG